MVCEVCGRWHARISEHIACGVLHEEEYAEDPYG